MTLTCLPLLLAAAACPAQVPAVRLPPGFEIVEFAGRTLADDIYTLTLDPRGRVVVSGRGYIRLLLDDDADGKADRAVEVAREPRDGAMGLLWEKDTLYFTGDGGLRKLVDRDGDGQADGPSQLIRRLRTGGEHHAHAVRRGPDGLLYVLCGNTTGIDASYAQLPTSPVKEPIAGCVLRFSPDLKRTEIVAHGLRNAYDMDFTPTGDLFTYDSDNERCVSLPWYEPTRLYHVVPGAFFGWLSPQRAAFWRMPPYHPLVAPPVATLERGSPTAVACYRHAQFPEKYRGGLFLADWTFGRIWFVQPRWQDGRCVGEPETFLQALGDDGFAPTGAAVHPTTGDLYVAIGGRGTRGGVYRIRYPKGLTPDLEKTAAPWRAFHPRKAAPPKAPFAVPEAPSERREATRKLLTVLEGEAPAQRKLDAVCLLQETLTPTIPPRARGTLWEGYRRSTALPADEKNRELVGRTFSILRRLLSRADPRLAREAARTLGFLHAGDAVPDAVAARLDPAAPIEDIHYLAVLACLDANPTSARTDRIAAALVTLDRRLDEKNARRDSNWPQRIRELFEGLTEKYPDLPAAVLHHKEFSRPDHTLLIPDRGPERKRAADLYLKKIAADPDYAVSAGVARLLIEAPADAAADLARSRWGKGGNDAALLALLARHPIDQDRSKFHEGLTSPQLETVRTSLAALGKLPLHKGDDREILALLQAWRSLPEDRKELAADLAQRLTLVTGRQAAPLPAWLTWFAQDHPERAVRLTNPDGVDLPAWEKRLQAVDWSRGDAVRGQAVFARARCLSCHSGSQAVGPDLTGVGKRFSRADLFRAIVQPSRDVPARYRTLLVETRDGKVYQGVVIYDAVDSLILQTGEGATVRLDGAAVVLRRPLALSLMPAGLLDPLPDRDLADLAVYLRSR